MQINTIAMYLPLRLTQVMCNQVENGQPTARWLLML